MAKKKQTPPPPKEPDIRDYRLVVYLTREDGEYLTGLAKDLGMKSRSSFVVAILERLIIGGFSARVFGKLGWQIANRIEEKGIQGAGFYFGIRPLPALPDEEWDDDEKDEFLASLGREIRKAS